MNWVFWVGLGGPGNSTLPLIIWGDPNLQESFVTKFLRGFLRTSLQEPISRLSTLKYSFFSQRATVNFNVAKSPLTSFSLLFFSFILLLPKKQRKEN